MHRVESGLVTGCQAGRRRHSYTDAAPGPGTSATEATRSAVGLGIEVRDLLYSPDGGLLVAAGYGRVAGLFDAATGARALTGNVGGAIEDFTAFIASARENAQLTDRTADREVWIATLREGRNPFDAATLAALRDREG
jgi:hypothetical protein